MNPPSPEKHELECSVTCPNRRREGISLHFGITSIHLDTVELLALFLLAMPIGITVRDTWSDKIGFQELMARTGAILTVIVGVRAAPTAKLSDILTSVTIGKN